MKTCATCKHSVPRHSSTFLRCLNIVSTYECEQSDCPSCDPSDAFIENDGKGTGGPGLIVAPTFGCVLHEEKAG